MSLVQQWCKLANDVDKDVVVDIVLGKHDVMDGRFNGDLTSSSIERINTYLDKHTSISRVTTDTKSEPAPSCRIEKQYDDINSTLQYRRYIQTAGDGPKMHTVIKKHYVDEDHLSIVMTVYSATEGTHHKVEKCSVELYPGCKPSETMNTLNKLLCLKQGTPQVTPPRISHAAKKRMTDILRGTAWRSEPSTLDKRAFGKLTGRQYAFTSIYESAKRGECVVDEYGHVFLHTDNECIDLHKQSECSRSVFDCEYLYHTNSRGTITRIYVFPFDVIAWKGQVLQRNLYLERQAYLRMFQKTLISESSMFMLHCKGYRVGNPYVSVIDKFTQDCTFPVSGVLITPLDEAYCNQLKWETQYAWVPDTNSITIHDFMTSSCDTIIGEHKAHAALREAVAPYGINDPVPMSQFDADLTKPQHMVVLNNTPGRSYDLSSGQCVWLYTSEPYMYTQGLPPVIHPLRLCDIPEDDVKMIYPLKSIESVISSTAFDAKLSRIVSAHLLVIELDPITIEMAAIREKANASLSSKTPTHKESTKTATSPKFTVRKTSDNVDVHDEKPSKRRVTIKEGTPEAFAVSATDAVSPEPILETTERVPVDAPPVPTPRFLASKKAEPVPPSVPVSREPDTNVPIDDKVPPPTSGEVTDEFIPVPDVTNVAPVVAEATPSTTEPETKTVQYDSWTVKRLQAFLKKKGQDTKGNKATLVERAQSIEE